MIRFCASFGCHTNVLLLKPRMQERILWRNTRIGHRTWVQKQNTHNTSPWILIVFVQTISPRSERHPQHPKSDQCTPCRDAYTCRLTRRAPKFCLSVDFSGFDQWWLNLSFFTAKSRRFRTRIYHIESRLYVDAVCFNDIAYSSILITWILQRFICSSKYVASQSLKSARPFLLSRQEGECPVDHRLSLPWRTFFAQTPHIKR